ncbi:hypothetical protein MMC31_007688 [Peltigera leucophlebia]|nr:hypothetical protein [Peltigera leucophlebia]
MANLMRGWNGSTRLDQPTRYYHHIGKPDARAEWLNAIGPDDEMLPRNGKPDARVEMLDAIKPDDEMLLNYGKPDTTVERLDAIDQMTRCYSLWQT